MFSANILLEQERYKKGITRNRLSRGICSQQLLIKAANSDTNIELFAFKILVERLGKSPESLEYILSKKEYDNVIKRDNIEDAILKHDLSSAEALLKEYIPNVKRASHVLQMYYYRTKTQITLYNEDDLESLHNAKEYILNAIHATLPKITENNFDDYLFSSYEAENIIIYAFILCLEGNTKTAASILEKIYDYTLKTIDNRQLLSLILPKCAYLMSSKCSEYITDAKLIDYCYTAFDILRDEGIIYMMSPLLTNLISLYEKNNISDQISLLTSFRDAIDDLYNKYAPTLPKDSLFLRWQRSSYNLDSEVFLAERLKDGLSQDDFADGVFSTSVSISHLENQKHTPNKSNYNKLMQRSGINKPRRGGFILTESFERLDFFHDLITAASKDDYDGILALISKYSDYSDYENKFIEACKCLSLAHTKSDDNKESAKDMLSKISEFYPLDTYTYERKPFLSETYIIITCLLVSKKGDYDYLKPTFDKLIAAFNHSEITLSHSYNSYATTIINYIISVGKHLSPNDITTLCDTVISLALKKGNGSSFSGVFWSQVCASYKRYEIEQTIPKTAVLFAKLFKEDLARYYEDYYNKYYLSQA